MDTTSIAWALIVVLTSLFAYGLLLGAFRKDGAILVWSCGVGAGALGLSLLLGPTAPPWWLWSLLGNTLIVSFTASLTVGLRLYLGVRPAWPWRFTLYLCLWVVGMILATVVFEHYPSRGWLISAFFGAVLVEFLVLTQRKKVAPPALSPRLTVVLRWFAGSLLVLYGLRAVLLLFSSAPNLLADTFLTSLVFLAAVAQALAWAGIVVALDAHRINARNRAQEEELRRLNLLKDRVLAVTGHDLRGPLGNLLLVWGEIGTRVREGTTTENDQELIHLVDQSLEGTMALVENLFAFADAQGPRRNQGAQTELARVIDAVGEVWGPSFRTKGVRLNLPPFEAREVRADEANLATVLRNLVGNALKFTPPGGEVTVKVTASQGCVEVEVADTGVGMEPAVLAGLGTLEPGRSRAGTRGERGSGFGLVLVRELVGAWGGTLAIDSQPGLGTRVTVTIPRAP